MNEQNESLTERNDRMRQIELVESLILYRKIIEDKRKNNRLIWEEVVDYLKRKKLYSEFEKDLVLEKLLADAFGDGQNLSECIEITRERVLVNYYLENIDKEAEKLRSNDEKAIFFKSILDDLCKQRLPSKHVEGIYIPPVNDDVLEGKITLVSMRYYILVGVPPR